jgi:ribokinase
MITVSSKGENSIVVVPGANAAVTPQLLESKLDLLRSAGLILTQFEIPVTTVEFLAEFSHKEGVPLIVDPAPARNLSTRALEQIEWFTPNETEATFYLGADNGKLVGADPVLAARLLVGKGAKSVVLKLGARGAQLASYTGLQAEIPPVPVHAVDTTAAGDTFNGAFATGLMLGMTPTESAHFASRAAAISVSRPGAQPSMPRMHELEKLL